jgi:glycosyltransferase involved in cell wall biosynthesis
LAPRGEFSPGALGIKKQKKHIFIFLSKLIGLQRKLTWHASTEYEKQDIERYFPYAQIRVAKELLPAGIQLNIRSIEKKRGVVKLLFLSRITSKKGLNYALRALESIKDGLVEFDIYGPIEDLKYWSECGTIIKRLSENILVRYCGELPHEKVKDIIPNYHLFVFPTLGENFGYVIIEAILSCRPVLISDRTPWRDLEVQKIGYDISLDRMDLFSEKIDQFLSMGQKEFDGYIDSVNIYASDYVKAHREVVEENFKLFYE